MQTVILTPDEIEILDRQDPVTERDGGFQNLLVELQGSLNRETGALSLTDEHEEKIPRYAFDYKNGGWEDRLIGVFSRTVGKNLGR
ncbi:MAG: aspartyl-tRNA synthetase [Verrucomicrobia bacterium]|nr:MAG: aspartyl-tRNA synthetase [Verrucomicrobiota bacterium]